MLLLSVVCKYISINSPLFLYAPFLDNCPPGEAAVTCTANPCDYINCYNHPEADCTVDNCGQCSAMFSVNGTDVTESCGENLYIYDFKVYCFMVL